MSEGAAAPGGGELVEFYRGLTPAGCGARIDEILQWPDERLERVHDYIQWLFPLETKSAAVPRAPVLDGEQIEAFRTDAGLRARLAEAFERMVAFYGFDVVNGDSSPELRRADTFEARSREWLSRWNHNYLRLTRIIGSLKLLGRPEHARALFRALEGVYSERQDTIGSETVEYWRRAAG